MGSENKNRKTKVRFLRKVDIQHKRFIFQNLRLLYSLNTWEIKNGQWSRSQKDIAQHASFALHNLMTTFRSVELPVPQIFKLFDAYSASDQRNGATILRTIYII